MTIYNLDSFSSNLFEWIDGFVVEGTSGLFSVKRQDNHPTLYGLTDIVFNLCIPNEIDRYLTSHPDLNRELLIQNIQNFQDPKSGWFKEKRWNFGLHFKEHSTAFAVAGLNLLGARPKYKIKIKNQLISKKAVHSWLKKTPEWGLLLWPGSHRGGGIGAIFATLGEDSYPHKEFFNWYFEWLDQRADPEVGFWRIGWIHKIKNRLTRHELGGAIHYYWIYEFLNHPIPYPKKVIDSTLALQNNLGLWDKDVSYCIDLDAIFLLFRSLNQTDGYRINDIKSAVIKYLDYTIPTLNDRAFFFSRYDNTHKLTGCLEAIAEIQKYMPELFEFRAPWIETLDITPWI